MKPLGAFVGSMLLFASCGLETVSKLSEPSVSFLDGTLVTDTSLAMVHSDSVYSGTDFQGYQIYYRFYPTGPGDFSRLVADRDALATSPTVSRLASLGYSAMTWGAQSDGSTFDLEEVLVKPGDGKTLKLDFASFLSKGLGDTTTQPILTIDALPATKQYLYRSSAFSDPALRKMGAVRTASVAATDMSALAPSYEINVFIVAYGFTPLLENIYSKPVPWGVLRTVQK